MTIYLKKLFFIIFCVSLFHFLFPKISFAQTTPEQQLVEGTVVAIKESGQETVFEELQPYQILEILITNSDLKGQTVEVKNSAAFADVTAQFEKYQVNDKLKIYIGTNADGQPTYGISGRIKRHGLTSLAILFVIAVLVIGRIWGALSLVGLGLSFLVIFKIIIPLIVNGSDPIMAALLGSVIIIPSTFYISHGFNKKTHVGVLATLISLTITGLLAVYFVNRVHLTGFASEEAGFLQVERQGSIDIKGILLAGIIIGTLGILDDVTIGQASVIKQIKEAKPTITFWTLFKKGMEVGQDHIASMVNTLVLVYSGSSLPLLLLFFDSEKTFLDIIEFEVIAEEIVKMLVGSIGLVLAAPLATIIAAYVFTHTKGSNDEKNKKTAHKERSFHVH